MLSVAPTHADAVVGELAALPATVALPSGPHDTLAAVAEILGGALKARHEPGEQADDSDGCGCSVELVEDGRPRWVFGRGAAAGDSRLRWWVRWD
ncbi:hypothetical protein [Kitasatospora purpeofusca]|uniref:hypothetical protein n=1 Tax=Kitasatospora purpeofusca TaxID=67352 RepID=UPI0036D27415